MRLLILLVLISCGKDPGKKGQAVNTPTSNVVTEIPADTPAPTVEMVTVKCNIQRACQANCINTFIACVEPCGGQGPDANLPQNQPCQTNCQAEVNACYNRDIQITRAEYEWILNN